MPKKIVNIRLRPDQEERINAIVERSAILDTSKFVPLGVDWLFGSDLGEELEAKLQEPFNRFSDTFAADEVELNFKYIIQASLHRRLVYAGRPPVKSAILATDSTMIHYMRLHAILTQGSPITVRVFEDRQRAADWLSVPLERLSVETKGFG